jgi:hypothetical protein
MSKQSKNANKRKMQKIAKASSSTRKHLADGESVNHYPGSQHAPHWLKPSGKKGWWNGLRRAATGNQ